MKKRQNKYSLGVSAFQIILALSLMSVSAVLLASGFRSAPSRGGSRNVVVNPAPAGAPQAATVQPAVVSPFSDEELAAQAAAEAELRAAERTKQTGFIQQPFGFAQGTAGEAPDLQSDSPPSPFEWVPMAQARLQNPRVLCTSMASGNWGNPAIWSCGFVPTAADDVTIANGHTVTIDTAAVALNLTVGQGVSGVLQYDPTTARSLTLGGNATVSVGGTFQAGAAAATHTLSIGGNLANNGTINFSQTAVVAITFTGAASNTWGGNGSYNLAGVTIDKGTSNANLLTFTPGTGAFTVQGSTTAGFLTITDGTFEIAGANAFSNNVFPTASYTIPATGGFWLNNANATVFGQNGSPINNGLLRLTNGTFNIGTAGTNVMGAGTGAAFVVEGGTMNVAGRLNSINPVTYMQSGGTVNICTAGGCTTAPSFGFASPLPKNFFNMSGGTINLVQVNTTIGTPVDWNQQGTVNYSGGTLHFGTGATAVNFFFRAQGNMPGMVIDTTTND